MAYIGNTPGVSSQRLVTSFTATAAQTTFTPTNGYVVGYVDVYFNGVKLIVGDDYTASNGVTVVLTTPAAAGDSIETVAYKPAGLSDGYTKLEADARYAQEGANTDITSMSGITGGVGTPDYVDFDTAATITPAVGRLGWDPDTGSLQMGMVGGNVSTHIGQTMHAYVTNAESVTINKGQPVYLYQAQGDRATVKLAGNTSDATSAKTLGLAAEDIGANQTGFVICQGVINNVNTAAFNVGDTLYLGATVGTLTATKPVAPNHLVYIGVVERANAGAGQIYVRPQNGYELDEIHDVLITSEVDGQVLTYESATGLWKNKTVATALGFTPENAANKGVANGYASLDGSGKVPSTQLPSYVDDVLEYANIAAFPATGETGKIYVTLDTNKTYRWSGSAYVEIASSAVTSVAGKTGVVTLTNSDVGLGNVENKSSATIRGELTSANVTTALGYTPPQPTGTGASGTWGISISGNAATATTATSATSATTATQVANTLTRGTYLTGNNFNGSAATTWAVDATTTATASKVVARDANADDYRRYGYAEFFNMSHGVSGATGDTIFYSSTDNFIRKNNATGFRASLNVPTRTGGDASGNWNISAANIYTTQPTLGYVLSGQSVAYTSQLGPQILGQGGSAAAITFHRPGAYAVNFGLDTDNQLKVGGWSMGGVSYVLLHSGNYTSYATGSKLQSQTFTGSGTFTVPSGVTSVWVTMVGGGSGGAASPYGNGAGGGAAGAYMIKRAVSVTPGAGVAVTIGGGGAGCPDGSQDNGSPGGSTSFGSVTCSGAYQGGGIGLTINQQSGSGGAAGGARQYSWQAFSLGGVAGYTSRSSNVHYGGGAGGLYGNGGNGADGYFATSAAANSGGGGGGGGNGGGNGGSGIVIVEWLG